MSQPATPAEIRFAAEFDQPVRYMLRTRSYYLGLGYENPYVWAHYIDAPFAPLKKLLSASRLALSVRCHKPMSKCFLRKGHTALSRTRNRKNLLMDHH